MRFILSFVLVFLLGFMPPLNFSLGLYFDPQILTASFFSLIYFAFYRTGAFEKIDVTPILGAFFVALGFSLFSSFVGNEIHGLLRILKGFLMFFGALGLVAFLRDKVVENSSTIMTALAACFLAHGIVFFLQMYVGGTLEFLQNYFMIGSFYNYSKWSDAFRMPGLMVTRGSFVSYFSSIGVLMGIYFLMDRASAVRTLLALMLTVLMFGVCVFSGRAGQMVVLLSIPVLFGISLKTGRISNFFRLIKAIVVLVIVAVSVLFYLQENRDHESYDRIIIRHLGFLEEGVSVSENYWSTVAHMLEEHIVFPSDARGWLLGDPVEISMDEDKGYSWSSDVGYIRLILGYGLFGMLAQCFIVFFAFFRQYVLSKNSMIALFAFIVLWGLVISNFKELTFFSRSAWPVVALCYAISAYEFNRGNESRKGARIR